MGYHSEQHLMYGGVRTAYTLPGHTERAEGDNARIVISRNFADEPQYRYFSTQGEAYRAAKEVRRHAYIVASQYWHFTEERWI